MKGDVEELTLLLSFSIVAKALFEPMGFRNRVVRKLTLVYHALHFPTPDVGQSMGWSWQWKHSIPIVDLRQRSVLRSSVRIAST